MRTEQNAKFSLPQAARPFTTVHHFASAEGLPERNRPHFHPNTVEFCSIVRGQLDWFVAAERYTVRPGDVLVIPANVVHGATDSNLQPCELFTAHLAPEQLAPNLHRAVESLVPQRLRQPEVGALIGRVFSEHQKGGEYMAETVEALGTLLVVAIATREVDPEEHQSSRLIRQAKRAIMGEHGIRPTVDEVAERLGVSSVWLHKLFVRETGASPGDWARAERLTQAKRMLEEGKHTTVEIAMRLGYATGQSFATAFRKESGMTPSEYRAVHSSPEAQRLREVYRVDMRETWVDGALVYPPA